MESIMFRYIDSHLKVPAADREANSWDFDDAAPNIMNLFSNEIDAETTARGILECLKHHSQIQAQKDKFSY